jgi:hypothetical protein
MSKKALVPVNVLASGSEPTGQYEGDLFFKSTEKSLYAFDGTNWNPVSGGSIDGGAVDAIFGGVNPTDGGSV